MSFLKKCSIVIVVSLMFVVISVPFFAQAGNMENMNDASASNSVTSYAADNGSGDNALGDASSEGNLAGSNEDLRDPTAGADDSGDVGGNDSSDADVSDDANAGNEGAGDNSGDSTSTEGGSGDGTGTEGIGNEDSGGDGAGDAGTGSGNESTGENAGDDSGNTPGGTEGTGTDNEGSNTGNTPGGNEGAGNEGAGGENTGGSTNTPDESGDIGDGTGGTTGDGDNTDDPSSGGNTGEGNTEPPETTTYEVIEGDDAIFDKGVGDQAQDLTFTFKAPYQMFKEVKLFVQDICYELTLSEYKAEGVYSPEPGYDQTIQSADAMEQNITVITLYKDFLQSLENAAYTLRAYWENGEATAVFTIDGKSGAGDADQNDPSTGGSTTEPTDPSSGSSSGTNPQDPSQGDSSSTPLRPGSSQGNGSANGYYDPYDDGYSNTSTISVPEASDGRMDNFIAAVTGLFSNVTDDDPAARSEEGVVASDEDKAKTTAQANATSNHVSAKDKSAPQSGFKVTDLWPVLVFVIVAAVLMPLIIYARRRWAKS